MEDLLDLGELLAERPEETNQQAIAVIPCDK